MTVSRQTNARWRLVGVAVAVPLCTGFVIAARALRSAEAKQVASWVFAAVVAVTAIAAWWIANRVQKH